jgi:hypothetical protein
VNDKYQADGIRVVDVDQAFPAMVDHDGVSREPSAGPGDVGPQVNTVIRDVLGWRPRVEDPKAFIDALTASFRLVNVEGHVEAQFVPRGYAVQADLGAVSGGQASLYRRALIVRTEVVRILSGLVSLRMDGDPQDMEAYRTMVRSGVERLVDELGTAGGPRVEVVDNYLQSLTGTINPEPNVNADTITGQLGALRGRFGLIDANVNTIEEEGIRTSFWTLVDMVVDLQTSWFRQKTAFSGGAGQGFIGTELILLSRLMEASVDQVDELEMVFDSVLISKSERRTLILNKTSLLTLDGLLMWMRTFLSEEGRHIAEDTGRDGIVAALTPTLLELFKTFKAFTDGVLRDEPFISGNGDRFTVRRILPASCCSEFPSGMYAARTRIAVAGTCRLLKELVKTAGRIGRYPAPVLTDVVIYPEMLTRNNILKIEVRGFNIRPTFIPAFIKDPAHWPPSDPADGDGLIKALHDTVTADDESMVGLFNIDDFYTTEGRSLVRFESQVLSIPAEDIPIAVIDGERGTVISAPEPLTWPNLNLANDPFVPNPDTLPARWDPILRDEKFTNVPAAPLLEPDPPPDRDSSDDESADNERELARGNGPAKKTPARKAPAKKAPAKRAPAKRAAGRNR